MAFTALQPLQVFKRQRQFNGRAAFKRSWLPPPPTVVSHRPRKTASELRWKSAYPPPGPKRVAVALKNHPYAPTPAQPRPALSGAGRRASDRGAASVTNAEQARNCSE
ncbi:hypothetical protein AOLI_G00101650 [Acnodon oligacanthus]